MKSVLLFLVFALHALSICAAENIQVYFSPHGGCTEAVTTVLGTTKVSVFVQAYSVHQSRPNYNAEHVVYFCV
jgi:hypothetical protein